MVRLLRLAILGAIVLTTTVLMALPRGSASAPAASAPATEPAPAVVTTPEAARPGPAVPVPPTPQLAPAPPAPPASPPRTHVVASGDTLGKIARRYYGNEREWRRIAEANPAVKPEALRPGDVLAVPEKPARRR